jgi:ribosome maturation factor RimP
MVVLSVGKKYVVVKKDGKEKVGFLVEINSTYITIRKFDGKEETIPFSNIDRIREYEERGVGGGDDEGSN